MHYIHFTLSMSTSPRGIDVFQSVVIKLEILAWCQHYLQCTDTDPQVNMNNQTCSLTVLWNVPEQVLWAARRSDYRVKLRKHWDALWLQSPIAFITHEEFRVTTWDSEADLSNQVTPVKNSAVRNIYSIVQSGAVSHVNRNGLQHQEF